MFVVHHSKFDRGDSLKTDNGSSNGSIAEEEQACLSSSAITGLSRDQFSIDDLPPIW